MIAPTQGLSFMDDLDLEQQNAKTTIVVVDDDVKGLALLCNWLEDEGFSVAPAMDGASTLEVVDKVQPSLLLLDLGLPDIKGEEVLAQILVMQPRLPVIIVTANQDMEMVVHCMRAGAFDYLIKPLDLLRTQTSVRRALSEYRNKQEIFHLRQKLRPSCIQTPVAFDKIKTASSRMRALFGYAETLAKTSYPVLISGETGCGKELMAEAIHISSQRKGGFHSLNVAGLDDQLFSDALFGHVRGAFTGADKNREGFIQKSQGGTLQLDEIGDLSKSSQVKLLRLLQNYEYYPLGSDSPRYGDSRFILTTHQNLAERVRDGHFRSDLFYRLSSHCVHIPPLRERREDIPLLTNYFVEKYSKELGREPPELSDIVQEQLNLMPFLGNVRELEGLIRNLVVCNEGGAIVGSELTFDLKPSMDLPSLSNKFFFPEHLPLPCLKDISALLVTEAIRRSEGNLSRAAKLLGVSRQSLSQRKRNKEKND